MHWNSIRYCIGFPPDFWYDIADEEGFLIQDEFPIWLGGTCGRARRAYRTNPKPRRSFPSTSSGCASDGTIRAW